MTFLFNIQISQSVRLPQLFPGSQWLCPHHSHHMEEVSTDRKMQLVASWQMSHPATVISLLLSLLVFSLQVNFLFSPDNPNRPQSEGQLLYKLELLDNLELYLENYLENYCQLCQKFYSNISPDLL